MFMCKYVIFQVSYKKLDFKNLLLLELSIFKKSHKLKVPQWIDDNLDKIMELMDVSFYHYKSLEISKLTTGNLLKELKENMLKRVNQSSQVELNLYSGVKF
jgi:hypothetical protein